MRPVLSRAAGKRSRASTKIDSIRFLDCLPAEARSFVPFPVRIQPCFDERHGQFCRDAPGTPCCVALSRLSSVLAEPVYFQYRHLDADDSDQLVIVSTDQLTGATRIERHLSRDPGDYARLYQP